MLKKASTHHKLIIGNTVSMEEIPDESVHLMVTSPPYFNAPFDYSGHFESYEEFLSLIRDFAKETFRVLRKGRIAVINCDDMLVKGKKYPIVADVTKIFLDTGFDYRDRITWKKPDGYLRISRRSGVMLQHPYPMYFYPDNLLESILIFQKGKFNYKSIDKKVKELSKIDIKKFQKEKWYKTLWDKSMWDKGLWEMTNVLPNKSGLERGIAAFPDELPRRIITLFSYVGETVLDPFLGSGTTSKVARDLGRNSIGIEIKKSLIPIIKEKLGFSGQQKLKNNQDAFEIIIRKKEKYGPID